MIMRGATWLEQVVGPDEPHVGLGRRRNSHSSVAGSRSCSSHLSVPVPGAGSAAAAAQPELRAGRAGMTLRCGTWGRPQESRAEHVAGARNHLLPRSVTDQDQSPVIFESK